MKTETEKSKVGTKYRRYSDAPVVQEKLEKAKKMLDKADLSFLDKPASKS